MKYRDITKEDFNVLIYKNAKSIRDFSAKFNVSKAGVFNWLKQGKIPTKLYNELIKVDSGLPFGVQNNLFGEIQ